MQARSPNSGAVPLLCDYLSVRVVAFFLTLVASHLASLLKKY